MIDDLVILFSTIACVVVVFRAIRLDAKRPWFGPDKPPPDAP
jgi:hypothetical protein